MNHDDLVEELQLAIDEGFRLTPGQADVMEAYHEGSGRVAVGAGAGTGKTATLTRVVAEAVLRSCTPDPESIEENPFEDILVTTFTRDAAGQLKSEIKRLLRDHEAESGVEFDTDLWRWMETASEIGTIDSLVQNLLQEVAADVGVAPDFDVRDDLETDDLRRELLRDLREDPELGEAVELLDAEFEDSDTTTREFIYEIQQKLREFCYPFDEETTMFSRQFRSDLHQDHEPQFDPTDISDIVAQLTGQRRADIDHPTETTVTAIENEYRHNIAFLEAVEDVVDAFESAYDRQTRDEGALSYADITYLVWQYLDSDAGTEFAQSLQRRFSHVFIDEFQDTSYAQCQILSHLVSNQVEGTTDGGSRTKVLVIGDVKQSVYGWRSADPEIFADILVHAERGTDEQDQYLGADEWTRAELETNFRSHPHLVRAANHIFAQLFTDPGRGDIGSFDVEYTPLMPFRDEVNQEESHLHVLPLGDGNTDSLRNREPQDVAAAIHGIIENGTLEVSRDDDPEDTNNADDESPTRPARAGDFTLLFRRSTYMQRFRSALDDHGIMNAVVAESGLFKTEEIGFLIDVLDWFANPHSKDSLLRILRSPITALSDATIRYIASNELDLTETLAEWPDGELPASDRTRLRRLVDLRSDLRWDREGSKADLVQKIIQHTAIETILLTGEDARQKYGNIWVLVEVTRDWEEEELMPYREFVERLRQYQERAKGGSGEFEVAAVADSEAHETVKLRTVHSAKGLEFDIVVLADLLAGLGGSPTGTSYLSLRGADRRELVLHPRHATDPVPYDPGPGSYWIHSDATSSIWLSTSRDDDGSFSNPHPFNTTLADQLAEYWRLLYVAFTRAGDHIIAPLGDDLHHSHRWTTWANAFNVYFRPSETWAEGSYELSLVGTHPDDTDHDGHLDIDVGQLPLADPIESQPIGLQFDEASEDTTAPPIDNPDNDAREIWGGVDFAPRTLSPSTLHDIIACPRRFQYRALQKVSDARGTSPPEANNPEGTTPSGWGDIVHQALELFHEDYRDDTLGTAESGFASYLRERPDIRSDIEAVVREYRSTTTWEEIQRADEILPEYELSALHPDEPQVHIQGFVDLLYQVDGDWTIIDYKTGKVAESGSYLANQYRWQLATYAWLLREEYGIDLEAARLVYVQDRTEITQEVDWDLFAEYLRDLDERLPVESGEGLPVRPKPDPQDTLLDDLSDESRCGTCPYVSICPAWQD